MKFEGLAFFRLACVALVTKQIFKDVGCRSVKGTGNGYVYVLVNLVGYNNTVLKDIYVDKGMLFV